MIAYEFYWRDKINGMRLIGILPERRKNSERITKKSIMNWLKVVLGEVEDIDIDYVDFVQIEV